MLRKYYLVLLLLIYSSNTYSSIWNEILVYSTEFCNCGADKITETWNGKVLRTIAPNRMCMPWNKEDGRTGTCLTQFPFPATDTLYYHQYCAERTSESSFFAPKIRVRAQNCNSLVCFTQSTTLNWDGECVIWPSPYGLPLVRICARVAMPAVEPTQLNPAGIPADPGYTAKVHLNDVGGTELDEIIIGADEKEIIFDRPKLCAYSDPGLINLVSTTGIHLDPLDWNAFNQSLHQTTELHPIIKILKFLIDHNADMNGAKLLGILLDMIGADQVSGINVVQSIIKAIGKIIEFCMHTVANPQQYFLNAIGSLNKSVDSYQFGCVELPFGPFPPPYCSKLDHCIAVPTIQSICSRKNQDGKFVQSMNAPCIVSKLHNNIINNSVRVSFNNLIPLCTKDTDLDSTSKCALIKNIEKFSSASSMHIVTKQRDTIKICSDSSDNRPCIKTNITCNGAANDCQNEVRIVYGQRIGNHSNPSDYYVDDLPDCDNNYNNNKTICQEIWGINFGKFHDISLVFPKIQNQDINNLLSLKENFILQDNVGNRRHFTASIVRKTRFDKILQFQQEPQDICIVESDSLIGCTRRANDGYKIVTYECDSNFSDITCPNNSYYTPQFIASIQAQDGSNDSTSTVVTPQSVSSHLPADNKNQTETLVNLVGYNFSSFMAYIPKISTIDDTYIAPPFAGPKAINPLTIYGKYKNDEVPYDIYGKATRAVYLSGLEYINGKYIQGGTHACLQPQVLGHCLPKINDTNCVLAKLIGSDTIDCSEFKKKYYQYSNLRICNHTDTNCNAIDSIVGKNNKLGITLYRCDNAVACYENHKYNNQEVCKISLDIDNRIDPSPIKGPVLNDFHYIMPNSDQSTYDDKVAAIRDKTSQELGLCVAMKIPQCSAISIPTNDSGNATWPATDIGQVAIGTCKAGWKLIDPKKPLRRYCLVDINTKTITFEPLNSNIGCKAYSE